MAHGKKKGGGKRKRRLVGSPLVGDLRLVRRRGRERRE